MTELRADELELTRRAFHDARTLPGAVYRSDEVFAREQSAIFGRDWVCVGRAEDAARTGDFFVREVAGESVLVLRGDDHRLRAFFNVCRHRGSRLVDAAVGTGISRLVCPYHAWSYHLDGRLQHAPQMPDGFSRDGQGLVPVRLGERAGFVFVTLDERASPLEQWLADLPDLARYRMETLRAARRIDYDVAANWKLLIENYSECYHCPGAHPQLHRLTETIGRAERPMETGRCFNGGPMRLRDGVATMSTSGERRLPLIPGLADEDARYVHYYVIYPNVLLSPHPDYVLVHTLWPVGPRRTRVHCEWLVTPEALTAPGDDLEDVVGFWDLTNRQDWALCERAQAGVASRGYRQGPYGATEDCVHVFDRWYADRLAATLSAPDPS
jgi:Rieske 2Fe-2S family protein